MITDLNLTKPRFVIAGLTRNL